MRAGPVPEILGVATLIGALLAGLFPVRPAFAMDPILGSPIPDDPIAFTFPRSVTDAMTFDIDGDGARELVTVGISSNASDEAALQVWWVDEEGQATGSNEVSLRRFDGASMGPTRITDGAALFAARRDGAPHLFVALEALPDDGSDPCCLTIREVTLTSDESVSATQVAETRRLVTQLAIADLDGDRTDELVVFEGPWSYVADEAPPLETALLRWDGSHFARGAFDLDPLSSCCTSLDAVGDTDGQPGDDLHLSTWESDGSAQRVVRVTLRGDVPAIEFAPDESSLGPSSIVPLEDGQALLTMNGSMTAQLWRWPRDQAMELQASRGTGCGVAAVLGSGPNARIVTSACSFPPDLIEVFPGNLGQGSAKPAQFVPDGRFSALPATLQQSLFPWEGRIPDGLPGFPDAYLVSGQLVFPVADPETLGGSQPAALLVGTRPVGRVGPAGAWEVLALNDDAGHYDPNPLPHLLWVPGQSTPGPLRLVRAESLTRPEPDVSTLAPTFHGAARDPASDWLLAGTQAVDAELHGPPGSAVIWLAPGVPDGRDEIGPNGMLTIPILPAGDAESRHQGGSIRITAVTPTGRVYWGQWSIRTLSLPPDLEVAVPDGLLMLAPAIVGRTSPGTAVTVNGIPADIGPSGAFRIRVEPGILPTEFRIVASDPVGNANVEVVSLVWPIDYRNLPFLPIVFLITVAAGIVLFVRRPVVGEHRLEDDESTIEEIGG